MEIPVLIDKVIFRNDNGFAILAASPNAYSPKYNAELEDIIAKNIQKNEYDNFIISVGELDANEHCEGGEYIFVGEFVDHPKYGKQFKSSFHYRELPQTSEGMQAYLVHEMPNIGKVRSKEMIRRFGLKGIIDIFDNNDLNKLLEINGLTEKRIPAIKEKWDKESDKRRLYLWLGEHGVSPDIGDKAYKVWGSKSFEILTENPYKLMELDGFGFVKADCLAHKILKDIPRKKRLLACMQFVLETQLKSSGNLCVPYKGLGEEIEKVLNEGNIENNSSENISSYKPLISECIKENLDIFSAVKDMSDSNNTSYIYLKRVWEQERFIAKSIYHRSIFKHNKNTEEIQITDDEITDAEKDIEKFSHRVITLDETQKMAIKSAFENKITVITGGGGTGKSTICRCIFHLAQEKKMPVRFMSPTGRAARVLSSKTGYPAETIHRSLKMKPPDNIPTELIREDIILIDETSMVGVDTMYAIMCALETNTWGHLVFVGDYQQLPSVSPGNFLFDIINSGCANVVKLDKIHRQDENSYVSLLANDIAMGKVVSIPEEATDIKWHELNREPFDVIIRDFISKFISESNIDDLQFIAPMYRGIYGINTVNKIIQEFMAEQNRTESQFIKKGFLRFHVGDRVVQIHNDYDKEVMNGDIGVVLEIGRKALNPSKSDEKKDYILVKFYDNELLYIDDEFEDLKLAWCISVHRFQGSQAPYIVFIMADEASRMLERELVYTSLTRCEKQVDIYGHMRMFKMAPTKSSIRKRYTNVNNVIKELRENRVILKVLEKADDKRLGSDS